MKYAALVTKSILIPGDKRSRTAPGHGYPKHIEDYLELVTFETKATMEAWVQRSCFRDRCPRSCGLKHPVRGAELRDDVSVKVTP